MILNNLLADPPFKIEKGFDEWVKSADRRRSHQVDYGVWWTLFGNETAARRWRVTWYLNTGELVAVENTSHGRYILLGKYSLKANVDKVMENWEYPESVIYHNLWALMTKIKYMRGDANHETQHT